MSYLRSHLDHLVHQMMAHHSFQVAHQIQMMLKEN